MFRGILVLVGILGLRGILALHGILLFVVSYVPWYPRVGWYSSIT